MGKRGAARPGAEVGGVDRRRMPPDCNPQSARRLTPLSRRAATNVSRACEEEAKLKPPLSLSRKVAGQWLLGSGSIASG